MLQEDQRRMRYVKTETGQRALKERSPQLSSRQRAADDSVRRQEKQRTRYSPPRRNWGLWRSTSTICWLWGISVLPRRPRRQRPGQRQRTGIPFQQRRWWRRRSPASPAFHSGLAHRHPSHQRTGLRGFRLKRTVEAASGYDDLVALLPAIAEALGPKKSGNSKRRSGFLAPARRRPGPPSRLCTARISPRSWVVRRRTGLPSALRAGHPQGMSPQSAVPAFLPRIFGLLPERTSA